MTPAEELRAAAALLRSLTEGFDADHFYRRDVAEAAERGIFSAPAKLWAGIMSPAVAEPLAALLESEADCQESIADVSDGVPRLLNSLAGDHTEATVTVTIDTGVAALTFARAITKAAGQ